MSAWFCHLSLFMSLPLATLLLSPIVPLSSSVFLFLALSAAPSARCLVSLTGSHLCLSRTPDHSSLGLAHPFLLSAFFLPCLSVCLSSCIISLSPHLSVLGPHPFFTGPVCPHHPLCLPQLSGKAAVIYELWTGPAAGAGGPDYGFPEEAACLGWQGDSVYRAAPAQSTPVSLRRMECWRSPVTSFTPLRANNKTLTHGLDTGSGLPKNIPSQAQGPELG